MIKYKTEHKLIILKIDKYISNQYKIKITKEALCKIEKFINIFLHVFTEETFNHSLEANRVVLIKLLLCCFHKDQTIEKVKISKVLNLDERVEKLLYCKITNSDLRKDILNIYLHNYWNTHLVDDMTMYIINVIDLIFKKVDDTIDVKKLSEIYNSSYELKILDEYMCGFNILN